MKSLLLALLLQATVSVTPNSKDHGVLYLIRPEDALKVTDTEHGDWLDTKVVLKPTCAQHVFDFTRQHIGERVSFWLLRRNQNGSYQSIDVSESGPVIQQPISDGILHLHVRNPHRQIGNLLAD